MKHSEMLANMFDVVNTKERLETLNCIAEGVKPKEIPKEVGSSRSGVQHFVNDFKDAGFVETVDREYELTGKGEEFFNWLSLVDEKAVKFEKERLRGFAFESSLSLEEMGEILENALKEERK